MQPFRSTGTATEPLARAAMIPGPPAVAPPAPPPARPRIYHLESIGPGAWYALHILAAHGEEMAFRRLIATYATAFVCVKCRLHTRRHLAANPLPPEGCDPLALFTWSVLFHNAVTQRIAKETSDNRLRGFSDVGAAAALRELTVGAAEDEAAYATAPNSPCEGCERPAAPRAAPHMRWVPPS